jgi:hypothetical protein
VNVQAAALWGVQHRLREDQAVGCNHGDIQSEGSEGGL